jgi:hypothetical protein
VKETNRITGHAETAHEQGVAVPDLGGSLLGCDLWNVFHGGYIPISKDGFQISVASSLLVMGDG